MSKPKIAAESVRTSDSTIEYQGVRYTESGTPELMDILSPKSGHTRLPMIVCIHGGGWSAGDRTEMTALLPSLAARGYCACTIDYRLAPAAAWPAQIEDCKCAVRFLRAHADALHLDPNRIGVLGVSAGGHLALMLGLTPHVAMFEGSGGWSRESSQVQSVLDLCGPTDLAAVLEDPKVTQYTLDSAKSVLGGSDAARLGIAKQASPIEYVTKHAPPLLIMHGDQDTVVPLSQSRELYAKMSAAGDDVTLQVCKGVGHGSYNVFASPENIQLADSFFDRTLHNGK